ncbi:MAG: SDR family NAD(P)-dependent oxidoreductase [Gordonia sp. (in: high G+C Gram-positive bacteria)]|uniref:SDR family NAD(P)-dependent oxidoreductase n=1 Tax=Gordonia sp. (in: high G+C Gram-positive bacteria) TaxID=84139 RepID=UPI003C709F0D
MFAIDRLILAANRNRRTVNARAVVTGAGSGIGRSFALELARRGGDVVCVDINTARADATASTIIAAGGHALSHTCDVADRSQMDQLAKVAEHYFGGPPSLVINNAGVGIGGRQVGDIGFKDWDWALGINLWGVVHGCEIFAPLVRQSARGGIINVASAAGFAASPAMGPYNVSKAGVMALSETLAAEASGTKLAVTVLCPTFVKTNVSVDGRITAAGRGLADKLMAWTGVSPDSIAAETLDAHDLGRLYVVPQLDATVIWHLKRYFPTQYARGAGLIGRLLPTESSTP